MNGTQPVTAYEDRMAGPDSQASRATALLQDSAEGNPRHRATAAHRGENQEAGRAVTAVRAMATLLAQLLHATFGSCVWTPTVHSLCYDVPEAFAIADLYPGREDSIEGCQQLARTILQRCLGMGDRNSECLRRWYGLLAARRRVRPADQFVKHELKRQLASYNLSRGAAVKRATQVLDRYTVMNGGRQVTGPPSSVQKGYHPIGHDPEGSWTEELYTKMHAAPSLTKLLLGHDDAVFGAVRTTTDMSKEEENVDAQKRAGAVPTKASSSSSPSSC